MCDWNMQVMMRFVFGEMTLDQTLLCDTFIGKLTVLTTASKIIVTKWKFCYSTV